MALPAASFYAGGPTVANGQAALDSTVEFIKEMPGGQAETELTISSGSVTATRCCHSIDTESDAATDDLANVVVSTNMEDGQWIVLTLENDARVVTLKHAAGGAGQMSLMYAADLVLTSTSQRVLFYVDIAASPDTLVEFARWGFDAPNVVEANTAASGSPNILTELESGKTYTNEGVTAANYHTLPLARAGLRYRFIVQDTDGIRVVANTGDTIRNAASVTPAAGYVEAATIGNVIELMAINATEWITIGIVGTWTVSS